MAFKVANNLIIFVSYRHKEFSFSSLSIQHFKELAFFTSICSFKERFYFVSAVFIVAIEYAASVGV